MNRKQHVWTDLFDFQINYWLIDSSCCLDDYGFLFPTIIFNFLFRLREQTKFIFYQIWHVDLSF